MKFPTLITAICLIFVWVGVSFAETKVTVVNCCHRYGDAPIHLMVKKSNDCDRSDSPKGVGFGADKKVSWDVDDPECQFALTYAPTSGYASALFFKDLKSGENYFKLDYWQLGICQFVKPESNDSGTSDLLKCQS